eukprot:1182880-Prorocentrum_minimum.AAC.4
MHSTRCRTSTQKVSCECIYVFPDECSSGAASQSLFASTLPCVGLDADTYGLRKDRREGV